MTTNPPKPFIHVSDLQAHQPFPEDGILTRTLYDDASLKVVLFTYSKGQELSEHTATMPAVLHFIEGEAELTLGGERLKVGPGAWVHMSPKLPHAISTKTPVRMVLYLIKKGAAGMEEGCA